MLRVGAIVRFLMLAVCLAPWASARQAGAALAPNLPLTPGAPFTEAPVPVGEEDDERETDAKQRSAAHAKARPATRGGGFGAPAARSAPRALPRATPPVPVDPFRNGLGSPYRC